MTALSDRKNRLIIETSAVAKLRPCDKPREILIECTSPFYASVRLKGTRTKFQVSYESIFALAVRQQVDADRKARAQSRKGRR